MIIVNLLSYVNIVFPSVNGIVSHDTDKRNGKSFAKEPLTFFALRVDFKFAQANRRVEKALKFAFG